MFFVYLNGTKLLRLAFAEEVLVLKYKNQNTAKRSRRSSTSAAPMTVTFSYMVLHLIRGRFFCYLILLLLWIIIWWKLSCFLVLSVNRHF